MVRNGKNIWDGVGEARQIEGRVGEEVTLIGETGKEKKSRRKEFEEEDG